MHPFDKLNQKEQSLRIKEIAAVFLKLGFFAYGGPVAHIAMMNEELVNKRKWLTNEHFLDLLSASNLIPGPNSTELAISIGYDRGKTKGLIVAGVTFILPAFLIVLVFAYVYSRYSTVPQLQSVLQAMTPVIIAIIMNALYKLFKSIIKKSTYLILLVGLSLLSLLRVDEIAVLALGAFIVFLVEHFHKKTMSISFPILTVILQSEIFLKFLKIGSILYGSGYVLIAYLERDFVSQGLLTSQQLLDAVTVGQMTPGPVFTTATFIGYQLGGVIGAILGTIGIFLPSFILVSFLVKITKFARNSKYFSSFLNGINIASLALMLTTVINLSIGTLTSTISIAIFTVSLFVIFKTKINTMYLLIVAVFVGIFI